MSGRTHTQITNPKARDYLAVMSRAVFQAGVSWALVDSQWDRLLAAFDGFDPRKVASYGDADVKRILAHEGIVHSERKIRATIHNAQVIRDLDREPDGFCGYLAGFKNYDAAVADLKERFSHIGDISAYYFMFRVGRPVPEFLRWSKTVKGDHPRIREMVAADSSSLTRTRR